MKIYQISFYDEFKCTCDQCSLTCCKGWLIPVDPFSYNKYQELKGLDHIKMKLSITYKDGLHILNKNSHTCTFYTNKGLCGLQCRYGEEMLCDTCKHFPRTTYNFDFAGFRSISLLCPEVVKLLYKHMDDFHLSEVDDSLPSYDLSHNDDKDYYEYLYSLYKKLINIITEYNLSLYETFGFLKEAGLEIQNYFFSEPNISADNSYVGAYKKIDDYLNSITKESIREYVPSISSIDNILNSGYYHVMLKNTFPFLYKLCQSYFKIRKNNPLDQLRDIKCSNSIDIEKFLIKYLEYSLLTNFYSLFDDYCFKRNFEAAIAKAALLERLLSAYSKQTKSINENDLPKLVCAIHRRAIDEKILL